MLVFAHRGASSDAPENTLQAIDLALHQQSDGIEVDVWQLDDEFVLIHDKWLSSTTNGSGQLSDYSLDKLQLLDAGNGQQIPTLKQVLQRVGNQCQLNMELKSVHNIQPLLQLLTAAEKQLNISPCNWLLSSFNHHLLGQLKQQRDDIRIAPLIRAC